MYAPPPSWTSAQRLALGASNPNSLLVEFGNTIDGWDGCDTCGNTSVLKKVGLIHGIDAGIAATSMADGKAGSFNDMDMLQLCNFGAGKTGKRLHGMSLSEYRLEYSVWAIMASNLILGNDVTTVRQQHPDCLALIKNQDIIAVNQDDGAYPPFLVSSQPRMGPNISSPMIKQQVLARRLTGGRIAVLVANRDAKPREVHVAADQLGLLARETCSFYDVIARKAVPGVSPCTFSTTVPSHDVGFFILKPLGP